MSASGNASPFTAKSVAAMIAVGVVAFCGFLVMLAYAPDLRTGEGDPGGHALSRSAVGYAALADLVRADGAPVVISRRAEAPSGGLWVLTPNSAEGLAELVRQRRGRPVLVVLPKWRAAPSQRRQGWVQTGGLVSEAELAEILTAASGREPATTTEAAVEIEVEGTLQPGQPPEVVKPPSAGGVVARTQGVAPAQLTGAGGSVDPASRIPFSRIDRLQTLTEPTLEPMLTSAAGLVLARLPSPNQQVLVLSDPDFLNTQGLRELNDARGAVDIIRTMAAGQAVTFDVTLHGYDRGNNLLRTAFEPPFLAATLCFLAAALLMGWHAAVRFGPAARAERVFAFGKTALADNAAGLIALTGREGRFVPAYANDTRAAIARAVGAPRDLAGEPLDAFLDRLSRTLNTTEPWSTLNAAAAQPVASGEAVGIAVRLHRFRMEMSRGRG